MESGPRIISTLPTETGAILGRLFRRRRMSYKFFWFLSLLELVNKGGETSIPVTSVLREMAVLAWHPVCFYRLSLGAADKLEEKIRAFQCASNLDRDSGRSAILGFLSEAQWATEELRHCIDYVPTRLLQTHFQAELEGKPDQQKDAVTRDLAAKSQKSDSPSMYWLRATCDGEIVELNEYWVTLFKEHYSILRAFAEYELCQYLQSRNPSVPGIVNKLHAPVSRRLEAARRYWREVAAAFDQASRPEWFIDIYTQQSLPGTFAIDHFLPWCFVAHDLLWNLTPVSNSSNSKKGDRLPDLKRYLSPLATLHHRALKLFRLFNKRGAVERVASYVDFFNMDSNSVFNLSEAEFVAKYWQVIEPQERIARFQGFSIFP